MTTLTEFLESREVFIAVVVAVSICVIGTIYFLIEKRYKSKKIEQNSNMDTKLVRVSDNQVVVEPVIDKIALEDKKSDVIVPVIRKEEDTEQIEEEKVSLEKKEIIPEVERQEEQIVKQDFTPLKKDERPVIPIEEFNEELEELTPPSVSDIYEEVKDKVEQEKLEVSVPKEERVEKIEYTEIEPNQEEAKEELKRVTEELLRTQAMQEQDNIDLTKFEEQQEEEAIISMDELMKKSKTLYEQNEITQYEDEGNEPISLQDLESRMNKIKEDVEVLNIEIPKNVEPVVVPEETNKIKLDDFNTVSLKDAYKEDRMFKSSPVISPIFGIEKKESTTNMELENTANYEKLDEEIKKTNEFLKALKELQKKLD